MDQVCFAPGIAYSRQELNLYISESQSFTLVAESQVGAQKLPAGKDKNRLDTTIVGFLVAEVRGSTGHLITIDVLPRARRGGVGSKLLAASEERLRVAQCRRVYLETAVDNLAAIAFYKRHQYFVVRTVPRYYSNGVDALLLEKDLLSAGQAS
jgi:ribosomal-protein-alanine N-acetyltransferase